MKMYKVVILPSLLLFILQFFNKNVIGLQCLCRSDPTPPVDFRCSSPPYAMTCSGPDYLCYSDISRNSYGDISRVSGCLSKASNNWESLCSMSDENFRRSCCEEDMCNEDIFNELTLTTHTTSVSSAAETTTEFNASEPTTEFFNTSTSSQPSLQPSSQPPSLNLSTTIPSLSTPLSNFSTTDKKSTVINSVPSSVNTTSSTEPSDDSSVKEKPQGHGLDQPRSFDYLPWIIVISIATAIMMIITITIIIASVIKQLGLVKKEKMQGNTLSHVQPPAGLSQTKETRDHNKYPIIV